jgi:hypothetical protein
MLVPLHARKPSIVASRSSLLRTLAQRPNSFGQAFALVDIEHSVLAHHWYDAGFAFLAAARR